MKNIKKINKKRSFAPSFWNRMSNSQKWLMVITLVIFVITTLPFTMVLSIGLLPSFTILLTDPRNTSKLIIVGCFNLAGVFVYLMHIFGNYSLENAFLVMSDVFNLIIMLSSAALGLIIYRELPNLFIFLSKNSNQHRLKNIDERLEKLTEEWGNEIISNQLSSPHK